MKLVSPHEVIALVQSRLKMCWSTQTNIICLFYLVVSSTVSVLSFGLFPACAVKHFGSNVLCSINKVEST